MFLMGYISYAIDGINETFTDVNNDLTMSNLTLNVTDYSLRNYWRCLKTPFI